MIQAWPVVGRGGEIAAIVGDLHRGLGMVVAGEVGVRKTIFAREVQRHLDADGWRTDLVRCSARSGFSLPSYFGAEAGTAGGAARAARPATRVGGPDDVGARRRRRPSPR
jgi:hypothetical protein